MDLLAKNVLDPQMKLLVLCGGGFDRDVLLQCGFCNVVISNLDVRANPKAFSPFEWSFQDAEKISFADGSFDFALVHEGLHHCSSPHRALLEMYRVARHGLLIFEPYDNEITRLGVRLNVGQEYEHAAVYYNDCAYGGVQNTPIPNYVYRWTNREIIKTVNTFAPQARHKFEFIHRMRIPWAQLKGRKNKFFYWAILLGLPLLKLFFWVFPKQSNNFASVILKPELPKDLHPWLKWENQTAQINRQWLQQRYKPNTHD